MQETAAPLVDSADLRRRMVDCQLRTFSITDETVLDAVMSTPREGFVDAGQKSVAYSDAALIVSAGEFRRTLLAPMVLARLLQNADIKPSDRILDVGGGTGYSAAICAHLAGTVIALESQAEFSEMARRNMAALGLSNVTCVTGPLGSGWKDSGLFDVILVNGAVEDGIESLLSQLAGAGRLLTIRRSPGQTGLALKATRYEKIGADVGARVIFDANALILKEFSKNPGFVF